MPEHERARGVVAVAVCQVILPLPPGVPAGAPLSYRRPGALPRAIRMTELIVVLFVVVLVFGATRIPALGDALGRAVRRGAAAPPRADAAPRARADEPRARADEPPGRAPGR
jgi:sec-independent protein translocase protein TatA